MLFQKSHLALVEQKKTLERSKMISQPPGQTFSAHLHAYNASKFLTKSAECFDKKHKRTVNIFEKYHGQKTQNILLHWN